MLRAAADELLDVLLALGPFVTHRASTLGMIHRGNRDCVTRAVYVCMYTNMYIYLYVYIHILLRNGETRNNCEDNLHCSHVC